MMTTIAHTYQGNTTVAERCQGEPNALMARSVAQYRQGDFAAAEAGFRCAMKLFEAAGDLLGGAKALGNVATLLARRGDSVTAVALLEQAAAQFHALGERTYESDTWRALAALHLRQRAWFNAVAGYERALALCDILTVRQRAIRWLTRVLYRILGVG